jgi:hypothetical protein
MRGVTYLIIFSLFVLSCKNKNDFNKISEGAIEYDISYSSDSSSSVPLQFLPKTMVLSFNEQYASYKIEDMMGVFCITNITNLEKRTHLSTIKIFNKKFKYQGNKQEVPVFFQPGANFAITPLKDTVVLAGVKCNKCRVTNMQQRRNFDVLFSNDFYIKHPNINTPYTDIDGVLMCFEIDLGKMRLTLTAKKVIPSSVNDKTFTVDDEYKSISQEQMREIIATMLR